MEAAMHALQEILRRDPSASKTNARDRVRVEITREIEREIMSRSDFHLYQDTRGREGPMRIMGIAFYVVHQLPEPGWRVIAA